MQALQLYREGTQDFRRVVGIAFQVLREDGRPSPAEVLGWVTGLRYRPEDLERAFFASPFRWYSTP